MEQQKKRRWPAVLLIILALIGMFVLGWRVMPKIWPSIKGAIFPSGDSAAPQATPEPYVPHGDAAYGDAIGETDSVVYYFYKDFCPHCRALDYLTTGLPDKIYLADGTESRVKLIPVRKPQDDVAADDPTAWILGMITEYYDEHNVPQEDRHVPAMVIGDRYLINEDQIAGQLMDLLIAGEGLKTVLLDGNARVPAAPAE